MSRAARSHARACSLASRQAEPSVAALGPAAEQAPAKPLHQGPEMPVRFDRALEARRGCKRRQEKRMRLEGDEVVERRLDLVSSLVLVTGRAHANVVEGKPLARSLLDLMPEQERSRGLPGEAERDRAEAHSDGDRSGPLALVRKRAVELIRRYHPACPARPHPGRQSLCKEHPVILRTWLKTMAELG
jgi:hypothetical protein